MRSLGKFQYLNVNSLTFSIVQVTFEVVYHFFLSYRIANTNTKGIALPDRQMKQAYKFLLRMQKENKHFTTKDIQEQTGYSRRCARDYPRKKWKWWLEPKDGGYYCKELYCSEEIFINCHLREVPPSVLVRTKVIYVFKPLETRPMWLFFLVVASGWFKISRKYGWRL
jgi:hypothetical protein